MQKVILKKQKDKIFVKIAPLYMFGGAILFCMVDSIVLICVVICLSLVVLAGLAAFTLYRIQANKEQQMNFREEDMLKLTKRKRRIYYLEILLR